MINIVVNAVEIVLVLVGLLRAFCIAASTGPKVWRKLEMPMAIIGIGLALPGLVSWLLQALNAAGFFD